MNVSERDVFRIYSN